ncbi:MAG TPA: ATP-binding protein [Gemmatales bacterium]|nr:ATP-binding protein [Gemmatales bacterium]
MWENGRFVLVSLAIMAIVVLIWATWLRIHLLKQIAQNKERSEQDQNLEHLYAELVEHASDVILRLDRVGNILAINRAGVLLLGYPKEELIGQGLGKFMPSEMAEPISFESSKEYALGDLVLLNKNQQQIQLEMSLRRERVDGKTRSAEIIARNVTERRRLEAQLRQSERMQAMGLLAGGVAHDFNNYLTVILNFADLSLESNPSEEIKQMLIEIRKAGLLASEMSRHMIDFSRRQVAPPQRVNLNSIILDQQRLLHSALGKQIEMKVQLTSGLPEILADVGSLEQILMNLVLNARDAITDLGKVTIRTLPIENAQKVLLEITDTGQGIDEATKARLFQPFFTTKEPDKGTGLGLASVQRLMLKMGGSIDVESKTGQGTTFRLVFSAAK